MSVTIGTLAGTTGLGTERQVIATASGDRWAFGFTGTNVLSSWYSQDDGASWTAGATLTLASNHLGEGRNLGVVYKQIGTTDVVHIGIIYKSSTSLGARAVRATIAGTTLTYHSSVTSVASPTADGDSLYFAGVGLELTSDNKVHFSSGFAAGGNGDVNSSDSTADAGSAEQMTPVTWASHVIDSNGVAHESRSSYVVDLGSTAAGLISDNGSGASDTTGLDWATWNGSAWSSSDDNRLATGSITAIDKNDWACIALSATDIHVVYRASDGVFHHRRCDGTTWFDGQTITSQSSLAGGGLALTSDGGCIWLGVIDTDSANTVRRLRWTPQSRNDIVDQWDSAWEVVEASSATRTFLGACRDVVNQTAVFYWTEGTSFVAAPFEAISPSDPAGAFIQSAQGSSAVSSTTFAVTFTTQNVVVGDSILVEVSAWNGTPTTITSVTDSAGNTYVKDKDGVLSDGTHGSQWRATITGGGGTKPTVTAHASAATAEWAMWVQEWASLSLSPSNYTDGSNITITSVAGTPITSGASTPAPASSGEIAIGFYFDGGNNIATIGVSAGWTQRGTSIQGTSTTAEGAVSSQNTTSGTGSNASFTLSATGSPAGVLVVVYKLASTTVVPLLRPGQTWRRFYQPMAGRVLPGASPASSITAIALVADPISSSAWSADLATATLTKQLAATSAAASGATAALSLALSLQSAAGAVSAAQAVLIEALALQGTAPAISGGTASLREALALQATSQAVSAASAALAEAIALATSAQAISRASGALAEAVALSAAAQAISGAAANLQVLSGTQIAGLGAAISTGTGTLSLAEALAATSQATSGASAALRLAVALASASQAISRSAAQLGLLIPLRGTGDARTGDRATLGFIVGSPPVAPPVLAIPQQGRDLALLSGQRSGASTGGRAQASTGGRSRAQPQEGRDDVEVE